LSFDVAFPSACSFRATALRYQASHSGYRNSGIRHTRPLFRPSRPSSYPSLFEINISEIIVSETEIGSGVSNLMMAGSEPPEYATFQAAILNFETRLIYEQAPLP
jgi:hypothetical protein